MIATYAYDPFGRRISKTVGGTTTYYLYSDEGLIGEYDSNGTEIKTYGYQPDSTWTTDPLFMKQGTDYFFYHNDHLGTPQKMTNISGAVVWSATYDAFGKATVDAASTVTNNLRFPGQYFDAETGLHYNWMRYYDSSTGRYVTQDPIGLNGGMNFYIYSKNNAIRYIDEKGLQCGSGWTEIITPNKPGGCDFTDCCQKHDDCYDNKPPNYCNKDKDYCDDKIFKKCMMQVCATYPDPTPNPLAFMERSYSQSDNGPTRHSCEQTANFYYSQVRNRQRAIDAWKDSKPTRDTNNASCECKGK